MLTLVVFVIVVALIFDYINGFHDAANSIATVVSTRVLSPFTAVVWAAFFNFVAFALLGTKVAKTIGGDLIRIDLISQDLRIYVLLSGVMGAIIWNLITWYLGLPTSSSHALIGGYGGAAIASHRGVGDLLIASGWIKTVSFIVLSPIIGLALGYVLMVAVYWIFRHFTPSRIDKYFRKLQLFSAATYSLGHGGNDAQKTMGIITGVLVAAKLPPFDAAHPTAVHTIPLWVVLICHAAMGLGTLSGGWRIVKTMGSRITKLKPVGGFCAETAGATSIIGATLAGIPVSTTHTITGAIVGVGSTRRLSAVKWGVANRIVWAWVWTIPASAVLAALAYFFIEWMHANWG